MKKEFQYLPSLNLLYLQSSAYLKHRHHVEHPRSAYHHYNHQNKSKAVQGVKKKLSSLSSNECSPSVWRIYRSGIIAHNSVQATERNLSPYEKRKLSERDNENERMVEALHVVNPTIPRVDRRREDAISVMKERIRKYIHDGGKVNYKYKRSLVDIEKRKRDRELHPGQASVTLKQAKDRLSTLQSEMSNIKLKIPKINLRRAGNSDIYCQFLSNEEESNKMPPNEEGYNYLSNFNPRSANLSALSQYQSVQLKSPMKDNAMINRASSRIRTDPNETVLMLNSKDFANKKLLLQHVQRIRLSKKEKLPHKDSKSSLSFNTEVLNKNKTTLASDLQIVSIPIVQNTAETNPTGHCSTRTNPN